MALPRGDGQSELWPENWDPLEVAYFAGLFDGDGSVAMYASRGRPTPSEQVHITNIDTRVLSRARELFGGRVVPHTPSRMSRQATWRWYVCGMRAERFLRAIVPHLKIKKVQAEIYLSTRHLRLGPGHYHSNKDFAILRSAAAEISRLKRGM
mgnify:FL=1